MKHLQQLKMAALWCISKAYLPNIFYWILVPLIVPMGLFCILVIYISERLSSIQNWAEESLRRLQKES